MLEINCIHHGDNLALLRTMPDNCIDAVVTDPPYGLSFMGKRWDYDVPSVEQWAEVLRVLKPGGHLLSFAGTRTQHRMAVNIEDAGFEIRDLVMWVYGSGFPKSLDVSKAIDKAAGAERATVKVKPRAQTSGTMAGASDTRPWIEKSREVGYHEVADGNPVTHAAKQWEGWGTALKPAVEPITLARKPLDGTVAENVQQWGTGGLDIDGCRVGTEESLTRLQSKTALFAQEQRPWKDRIEYADRKEIGSVTGRWPANLIHDGSDEVMGLFPGEEGESAARFFYVPKPSSGERDEGCEGLEMKTLQAYGDFSGTPEHAAKQNVQARNHHPTVKPVELMEYLVRLISREGQIVLDPWGGSGTTGVACKILRRQFILMEREAEYVKIAEARIGAKRQMKLL